MAFESPFIGPKHKDFCHPDTSVFVTQAGKMLCMRLGDVVKLLMDREGLSYADVAARVRAAGGKKTKWQSIQQLVTGGVAQPKYEMELARAFGLSIEDLRAGRIDKHPPNEGAPPAETHRGSNLARPSQSMGLDRSLLRQAVTLLRRFELSQDQRLPDDVFAERLADLYEVLPTAPQNVTEPEGAGK